MPIQTGEGTGPSSPHTASLCAEAWVELRDYIFMEEEPGLRKEAQALP